MQAGDVVNMANLKDATVQPVTIESIDEPTRRAVVVTADGQRWITGLNFLSEVKEGE